ncbi:MAG: methyltransferase domain-containing protein [Candidatus Nitronauta litoralis]|uniref:Methyltransferase domain-containing protein n=1 Tax=Candidatus Nitronauta litoralis TaxID=2705533 RepID=A0A7T0G0V3_9BACT|nr:MAG: methyltransferase domain-containing protein [Candidatus Nitronauta litoralis]
MSILTPPRKFREELLDLDQAPFEEVKDSLKDVQTVNEYLSGYRVLLHHIEKFFKAAKGAPLSILDAATGSADQPRAVIKLARQKNWPVQITALDINRKMLRFSREETRGYPEISFVQGDVLNLPFKDNSFDVVINNLSLHHFERQHAIKMMSEFSRLSRMGFIINDLHRSRVAHAAIWILTRLLTKNRLTRYDAPVSVYNAFTPDEMEAMAREAGLKHHKVHRHFPYRLALVENKTGD